MTHEEKDYIQILRSSGYRVTPQRLIVLDAVCELGGHATINAIQARVNYLDSTINRSTIYRALDVLAEVGLITESDLGDEGIVYRISGESRHHHLVCQSCGAVLTIDTRIFDSTLESIYQEYGFTVRADHLSLKGLCKNCQGEKL